MDGKTITIYMHINKINNKTYIGQTKQRYLNSRYRNGKGYYKNVRFYNDINKYGWDNFEHIIVYQTENQEKADEIEKEFIKTFNSTNREYGYNLDDGGKMGYKHSEESKKKLSETRIGTCNPNYGKIASKETRMKQSFAHKGTKQTEEWINKRKRYGKANGMYGRNVWQEMSKEQKEIFREKTRERSQKTCYLILLKDNSVIKFDSLKDAYEYTGSLYGYCRKNRLKGIEFNHKSNERNSNAKTVFYYGKIYNCLKDLCHKYNINYIQAINFLNGKNDKFDKKNFYYIKHEQNLDCIILTEDEYMSRRESNG